MVVSSTEGESNSLQSGATGREGGIVSRQKHFTTDNLHKFINIIAMAILMRIIRGCGGWCGGATQTRAAPSPYRSLWRGPVAI